MESGVLEAYNEVNLPTFSEEKTVHDEKFINLKPDNFVINSEHTKRCYLRYLHAGIKRNEKGNFLQDIRSAKYPPTQLSNEENSHFERIVIKYGNLVKKLYPSIHLTFPIKSLEMYGIICCTLTIDFFT